LPSARHGVELIHTFVEQLGEFWYLDDMSDSAIPLGFRGTRGELLVALKKSQPVTAKELAERFHVTPNALRRHLKELELEGVVRYSREIRGVGGPVFAYSLTPAGEALFPRAYEAALTEVLDLVQQEHGDEGVVQLFRRRWEQIAAGAKPELAGLSLEQRARRLAELLTSLGYMAEVGGEMGSLPTITEHNCAIRLIAERFPDVCAAEQGFIAEVLGVDVTRQAHIAKGANCCEYCIQMDDGSKTTDDEMLKSAGMTAIGHRRLEN
jgi:DeoR family transcriptional regulator, suf operon transcriptional repressor